MYYEMFVEMGMDVTWKELEIECTIRNSWNAMEPEHQGNGEVIDHIIYNRQKMKVLEGEIIEMEKPLSDHKPGWALMHVK